MMPRNTLVLLALAVPMCFAACSLQAASAQTAVADWTQIAVGVYQRVDADGSVYRQSFGDDGARFELAQYQHQLDEMLMEGNANSETVANLRAAVQTLKDRVDAADAKKLLPALAAPPSRPIVINASAGLFGYNNTPVPACGFVAHQMADFRGDAAIEPGGGFGEATSSIMYYGFVPGVTGFTATFFVSASVTPAGFPTQSVNATTTATVSMGSPVGPTLFTRSVTTTPQAFSVSASTSSFMNIPSCTGGFQSFAKTQPL